MELSSDQKSALDQIIEWWKSRNPIITLGGFAGCGKTTLIGTLRNTIPETTRIAFCAYTGKAASVLRSKLIKLGINRYPNDYCGTIHGLIYEPRVVDDEIVGWVLKPELSYDIIICDESSMVSEDIFNDLKSYDIPILFVGDHGQLPPIEGALNLMANPQIKLEKVHRFAEQNPLTKISIMARMEGYIPHGRHGDKIIKVKPHDPLITEFINNSGDFTNTAILCGFNNTRVDVNKRIRTWKGFKKQYPEVGERVICLKNNKNAKKCPIYNGILGTAKYVESFPDHLKLRVNIDGEPDYYLGRVSKIVFNNIRPSMNEFVMIEKDTDSVDDMMENFQSKPTRFRGRKQRIYLDCFDFGYCLTVHKSQGSEWERVMVIEQPCDYWSGDKWNKWLYTAVTRSTTELLIVR